jgi:hypothetical protein
MSTPAPIASSRSNGASFALFLPVGLPILTALVVSWLRPDLMELLMDSRWMVLLLSGMATVFTLDVGSRWFALLAIDRSHPPGTPGRSVRMALAFGSTSVLVTVPGCLLVAFAPVVFAFKFGATGAP